MRVLVACEESQVVCKAFRERGHEAYSCDIQPCSGGHPEWHIQADARELLKMKWDLVIAHPPCTYLSSVGASRLFNADHTIKSREREREGWEAKEFFLAMLNADAPMVAVENPAPLRYWNLPPYSQIIEPYQYGHTWKKRTCLWLRGLPELQPTNVVKPTGCWTVSGGGKTCRIRLKGKGGARSSKDRAKTFPGIAAAMAEQWGQEKPKNQQLSLWE